MKKNNITFAATIILIAWFPLMLGLWDKDKPAATLSLRSSNPQLLANNSALEDAIGQDHEFSTGGNNSGKHLQVTFDDPLSAAPATVAASEGVLYTLDVSSKAELHFEDEDENTLQITSGGDLYSSTGLTVTNNATFNGGITLGAGDDLIGSATSDITINMDKFTVAGATGNTVIGGTFDVTGNIDPTTYETTNGGFLDEDAMGSDAADKVASQQSIKAYVDTQIAAYIASEVTLSAYCTDDSESNAMLKAHAYKAVTPGVASVFCYMTAGLAWIKGYVGATSDPVGAGTLIHRRSQDTEGQGYYVGFDLHVAKDEYFEITTSADTPTIRWISLGTLSKPVDQD